MDIYDSYDVESEFLGVMREAGLLPSTPLIADGRIHRCPVAGHEHRKDGAYKFHMDGVPAGWYQNHCTGTSENWHYSKGRKLSDEERAQLWRDAERAKQLREGDRLAEQERVSSVLTNILKDAPPASFEHPYLKRKQVEPMGNLAMMSGSVLSDMYQARTAGRRLAFATASDELLMPMQDANGQIWTVERILPDGRKQWIPKGKKSGTYFPISGDESRPFVVAEGLATALSIAMATGLEVIVAGDCGNLLKAAKEVQKVYSDRSCIFAADNDVETLGNPGVTEARNAARKVGGSVIIPDAIDEKATDWNDMAIACGVEYVRERFDEHIMSLISAAPPEDEQFMLPDEEGELATESPTSASLVLPKDLNLLSDLSNAELLLELHGDNIRYCREIGGKDKLLDGWLAWRGTHWERNSGEYVHDLVIDMVNKDLYSQVSRFSGNDLVKLQKHIKNTRSERGLMATLKVASRMSKAVISARDLDNQPWLLNVKNGTLDLRTGTLAAHNRAHLLTKMINVEYDPDASCTQWKNFLDTITGNDNGLQGYLQRVLGYCLTGDVSEQCMWILFGFGRNGKSVFLKTISGLLGEYAKQGVLDMFTQSRPGAGSQANNAVADLQGARFVALSEAREGAPLQENLIKQITGGEVISARKLYENFHEFMPEFKLFLATNHKPTISDTGYGMWRRIKLIPFNVQIEEKKVDKQLGEKLAKEYPGILAWMVEGCKLWIKDKGLAASEPPVVKEATAEYKTEMDRVQTFINECVGYSEGAITYSSEIYEVYTKWCEEYGERRMAHRRLSMKLKEHGLIPIRGTGGNRAWKDIYILPESERNDLGDSSSQSCQGFKRIDPPGDGEDGVAF